MSISAISGNTLIAGIAPTQAAQAQAIQPPAPPIQGPDRAEFSGLGSMLSELAKLQKADPDKFKEIVQKASDDLATAAGQTTDPAQAGLLSEMSSKFAESARTGAMPDLRPGVRAGQAYAAQDSGGLSGALGHGAGLISDLFNGVANLLTGNVSKALGGGKTSPSMHVVA